MTDPSSSAIRQHSSRRLGRTHRTTRTFRRSSCTGTSMENHRSRKSIRCERLTHLPASDCPTAHVPPGVPSLPCIRSSQHRRPRSLQPPLRIIPYSMPAGTSRRKPSSRSLLKNAFTRNFPRTGDAHRTDRNSRGPTEADTGKTLGKHVEQHRTMYRLRYYVQWTDALGRYLGSWHIQMQPQGVCDRKRQQPEGCARLSMHTPLAHCLADEIGSNMQ